MPFKPPKYITAASAARREAFRQQKNSKPVDEFYRSGAWIALRARVMREEQVCYICGKPGGKGDHADHILSRRERPDLALDRKNLRRAHKECHSRKGAMMDGLYGNPKQHPPRPLLPMPANGVRLDGMIGGM